jgi:hypothetical protein
MQKFILIAILSVSGIVSAQNQEIKVGEAELFAILKIMLKSDSLSFEQFRNIGKCRCMDTLMMQRTGKNRKNAIHRDPYFLYDSYRIDISNAMHVISEAIIEDTINSVLDRFYIDNIDLTIKHLRKSSDEYYNINRSSYMICETMYMDIKKLRSLYHSVIESDNSYNKKTAWWNEKHVLYLIALFKRRDDRNIE